MDTLPTKFKETLLELLSSASLPEKRAALIGLSADIKKHEAAEFQDTDRLKDYVCYIPSFVQDQNLIDGVQIELASLNLDASSFASKKVKTCWLSESQESYDFTGSNNPANDITKFPNIYKLMEQLNESEHSNSNLNSCLITCYSNYKKALSLHSDNEEEICQLSSICNVSFGCTRKIEFVPISGSSQTLCSFDLEHGSLNVMKPGCNRALKHRVPPGTHNTDGSNIRYSISFRKFIPKTTGQRSPSYNKSPVKEGVQFFEKLSDGYQEQENLTATDGDGSNIRRTDVVLFAGDSHFAALDCDKLGKDRAKVINISVGGLKINQTEKSIDDFYVSNRGQCNVTKVFVSVGSNDIRNCRRGVLHLTKPLRSLTEKIITCFPNAKIWYQSLLPLPIVHQYVVGNVVNFNRLLEEICTKYRIFFHDVFDDYLGEDCHRNYRLFENSFYNVHLNSVGLGRLAKSYINLIHRNNFNPRVFNIW